MVVTVTPMVPMMVVVVLVHRSQKRRALVRDEVLIAVVYRGCQDLVVNAWGSMRRYEYGAVICVYGR